MSESLRSSLGLPSWVSENMIYALVTQSQQKATNLIDPRQETIREKIRIAPGNSTKTLLGNFGYQHHNGIYPDFLGKNILDIGGGFGGVAPILGNSAQRITVLDPIFREDNYNIFYQEDIGRMERRMKAFEFLPEATSDKIRSLRIKNFNEQKQVQKELLWWNNYQPKGIHSHIDRNGSYGENLEGIQDNSVDVIFINYVISKKTVHPENFLKEIQRVLRKNGYVIISDNDMSPELLTKIFGFFEFQQDDIFENQPTCFIGRGRKKI